MLLTKNKRDYTGIRKQLTLATRFRRSKIIWYIISNPGHKPSDIYKAGITKNIEDLNCDIKALIDANCIKQFLSFKNRLFVEPLTNQYPEMFKIFQSGDKMISTIKTKLNGSNMPKRLHKILSFTHFYKLQSLINEYNCGIIHTKPLDAQLLPKMIIILVQKLKVMSLELEMLDKEHDKRREQLSDNDRKYLTKLYERRDKAMNHLMEFVEFFTFFIENYDFLSKRGFVTPTVERFSGILDHIYTKDNQYRETLKSKRRKSLKYKISLWIKVLLADDVRDVVEEYDYQSTKALLKPLKSIQDALDHPNINKIIKLQKIEENRIGVPETSLVEILLLTKIYDLKNKTKILKPLTNQIK